MVWFPVVFFAQHELELKCHDLNINLVVLNRGLVSHWQITSLPFTCGKILDDKVEFFSFLDLTLQQ